MDSPLAPSPHASACYEKMEEDLTCPVCLELYADPLMMKCSHSICKTCLNDIKMTRERLGKTEFECPTCREVHPIVSDLLDKLPKNLVLENIVIRFQEIKSTSLIQSEGLFASNEQRPKESSSNENDDVFDETLVDSTCGMCDENQSKKAEWFCPQCDVLYCQGCLNTFHPRKGSLSRHKVCKPIQRRVIKENALYCPEHTSERASIFCDTCKVVACHLCVCQGQGSHGSHVILDLTTAKEKVQTTFSKASEDLSVLISAFGLREKEMDSQLETIKSLHDSAQAQIASQFQCFMSDTAATLHLARRKFQESVSLGSSRHSQPVEMRSKQTKSALRRCLILMDKCSSLLDHGLASGQNRNSNKPSYLSSYQQDEFRHFRARSLPQPIPLQGACGALSLSDENPNSPMAEPHRAPKTKPKSRRSLSLLDQKESTQLPSHDFVNRLTPPAKSQEEMFADSRCGVDLLSRNGNSSKVLMASTPVHQGERRTNRSPVSLKTSSDIAATTNTNFKETNAEKIDKTPHIKQDCNESKAEKPQDGMKAEPDKTSTEVNVSTKNTMEECKQGLRLKSDSKNFGSSADFGTEGKELNQDDLILTRAAEIDQILEEIMHLTKELDLLVVGNEEDLLSEVTTNLSSSLSSFNDVAVKLLSYLTTNMDSDISDIPIMMPAVRSVASPVSPGQKAMPRVQSRTLITWGFNSTSFTAEPVELKGQWTINIARNTSHIGDLKTGYLFGVGVARQSLTSKEQVGMNPYSYGIICSNGNLAFCHNSHVTPITLLSDLPLTIRLAVSSSGHLGILLSYWITLPGSMGTIQGRRVIALHSSRRPNQLSSGDGDGDCHSTSVCVENSGNDGPVNCDSNTEASRPSLDKNGASVDCKKTSSSSSTTSSNPMLPVFTVSQRVKMTFPINSEES